MHSFLQTNLTSWDHWDERVSVRSYILTMTMTMQISLFDINHLNTMIRENKDEKK